MTVQAYPVSPGLGPSLKRVTDGIGRLVREHLQLARAEVREDLKRAGRDLALIVAGLPPLCLGWALVMVAISLWLAKWVGSAAGFLIVGAVHLLAGAALAGVCAWLLATRDKPSLTRTGRQLEEDRRWLTRLGS